MSPVAQHGYRRRGAAEAVDLLLAGGVSSHLPGVLRSDPASGLADGGPVRPAGSARRHPARSALGTDVARHVPDGLLGDPGGPALRATVGGLGRLGDVDGHVAGSVASSARPRSRRSGGDPERLRPPRSATSLAGIRRPRRARRRRRPLDSTPGPLSRRPCRQRRSREGSTGARGPAGCRPAGDREVPRSPTRSGAVARIPAARPDSSDRARW